jgi:ABC-2 type transport system ATP-binding protein
MGEVILKIENGTKKFKNELIFQNVSMEFEKGNSYGFVGPNGCGKSVFFKTLCGYSLLTEGQVIYRGKIIGKEQDNKTGKISESIVCNAVLIVGL